MNHRRWILVAVAVMVTLGTSVFIWRFLPRYVAAPTSFSPSPQGVKAIYLLLGKLGDHSVRWEQPWDRLPKTGSLLVYQPDEPVFPEETRALLSWVRSGHLVWVETENGNLIRSLLGTALVGGSPRRYVHPLRRDVITAGVRSVFPDTTRRIVPGGAGIGEVGDGRGWVVAIRNLGRGRLVVSTGYLLANANLARGGNLRLALNILGRGPVLFDEYHHGYALLPAGRKTVAGPSLPPNDWVAVFQAAVAVGLALYWAGARLGPPLAPTGPAQPWAGEYALAQARLFRRAGAARYVLRELLKSRKGRVAPSLAAGVTRRLQAGGKPLKDNELLSLAVEIVEGGKDAGE